MKLPFLVHTLKQFFLIFNHSLNWFMSFVLFSGRGLLFFYFVLRTFLLLYSRTLGGNRVKMGTIVAKCDQSSNEICAMSQLFLLDSKETS